MKIFTFLPENPNSVLKMSSVQLFTVQCSPTFKKCALLCNFAKNLLFLFISFCVFYSNINNVLFDYERCFRLVGHLKSRDFLIKI